jgi:predicted transcriptional regulator
MTLLYEKRLEAVMTEVRAILDAIIVVGDVKFIFTKAKLAVLSVLLSKPPRYAGAFIRVLEKPGTSTFEATERYPTVPSRYLDL